MSKRTKRAYSLLRGGREITAIVSFSERCQIQQWVDDRTPDNEPASSRDCERFVRVALLEKLARDVVSDEQKVARVFNFPPVSASVFDDAS